MPAQFVFEQRLGVVALLGPGTGQHLKMQVGALVGPDEALEGDVELILEVLLDVFQHIGLGRGGEAADGGQRAVTGELLDEARNVEVIRAKVRAPFGQAVSLVEDPGADLALGNGPAEGLVAKLLGRDQQDAHVPQLNLLQHLGPSRGMVSRPLEGGGAIGRCGPAGHRPGPSSGTAAARRLP